MRLIVLTYLLLVLTLGISVSQATAQESCEVLTANNIQHIERINTIGRGTLTDGKFSPNGNLLAFGTALGVWIYNTSDWEASPVHIVSTTSVQVLGFTPDGAYLVVVLHDADNRVHTTGVNVYATDNFERVRSFTIEGTYSLHDSILLVRYGELVETYDVSSGVRLASVRLGFQDERFVNVIDEGHWIVTEFRDPIYRLSRYIRDMETGAVIRTVHLGDRYDNQVFSISPDGQTLVLLSRFSQRELVVTDDIDAAPRFTVAYDIRSYSSIRWARFIDDGRYLALWVTQSMNGNTTDAIEIINVSTGEREHAIPMVALGDPNVSTIFSLRDQYAVVSSQSSSRLGDEAAQLTVWDLLTGHLTYRIDDIGVPPSLLALDNNETRFVFATSQGIRVYDLQTERTIELGDQEFVPKGVSWSRILFFADANTLLLNADASQRNFIYSLDLQTQDYTRHSRASYPFARISPLITSPTAFRLDRLPDDIVLPPIEDGFGESYTGYYLSPDGRYLSVATVTGVGNRPNDILLYEMENRQLLGRFQGHAARISGIYFDVERHLLISTGIDPSIFVWDLDTMQQIRHIRLNPGTSGNTIAVSPDRETLYVRSTAGRLTAWTLSTGLARLLRDDGYSVSQAFNEMQITLDGTLLIQFIRSTHTVQFMDTRGAVRFVLPTDAGLGAALSQDGRILATRGYGDYVELWCVRER